MDLALNNVQWLIFSKNQPTNQPIASFSLLQYILSLFKKTMHRFYSSKIHTTHYSSLYKNKTFLAFLEIITLF